MPASRSRPQRRSTKMTTRHRYANLLGSTNYAVTHAIWVADKLFSTFSPLLRDQPEPDSEAPFIRSSFVGSESEDVAKVTRTWTPELSCTLDSDEEICQQCFPDEDSDMGSIMGEGLNGGMLVKEEESGESALGFLEDSGLWAEDGDDSGDGISNSDVLEPAHAAADMSVYASSSSSNESSQEDITDALERYLDRLSSPTPISVSTESVSNAEGCNSEPSLYLGSSASLQGAEDDVDQDDAEGEMLETESSSSAGPLLSPARLTQKKMQGKRIAEDHNDSRRKRRR